MIKATSCSIKILAASSLAITFSSFAYAHPLPHLLQLNFECPTTNPVTPGDIHVLKKSNGTITGLGWEYAGGIRVPDPLFTSTDVAGVPDDLGNASYYRSSVEYNPENGLITCNYTSSATFPAFQVFYLPSKADGGMVIYSTPKSISVRLLFGLKQ